MTSLPADGEGAGRLRRWGRRARLAALIVLAGVAAMMLLPPDWFGMGTTPPHLLQARMSRSDPGLAIVDVRTGMEFRRGHIPGAVSVPLHALPFRLGALAGTRDREVVLICFSGHRSRLAGLLLRLAGFDRVTNLAGGMAAWRARGYRSVPAEAPQVPA